MTGAALAALQRFQRECGRLERASAEAVMRAADALGVTLAIDGGQLVLRGPREACEYLTPAIRRHKLSLLAGRCGICRHDLAIEDGCCAWCSPIVGRRYVYAPGSVEETAFLADVARAVAPMESP